jgi:hypothetical protein
MKVFKSGFTLVCASGQYSDYHETILAFSPSEKKLEKIKNKLDKELELLRNRFEETKKERDDYMDKFRETCIFSYDENRESDWVKYSNDVRLFVIENPIPDHLSEFVSFTIYKDGNCDLQETYELESDLDYFYCINKF